VIPDPVFGRILSIIDKDNDGTVTYSEFSQLLGIEDIEAALKASRPS